MRAQTTTRRHGLQATAEIYLKEVSVDEDGFVKDYEIAYLDGEVDPQEIKQATRNALNLDEPERVRLYDENDRYLAGHPGTPRPGAARRRRSARDRPPGALVVINAGGVTERVCGRVMIVDFSELAEDRYTPAMVERLATTVAERFGERALRISADLRELARHKRGDN